MWRGCARLGTDVRLLHVLFACAFCGADAANYPQAVRLALCGVCDAKPRGHSEGVAAETCSALFTFGKDVTCLPLHESRHRNLLYVTRTGPGRVSCSGVLMRCSVHCRWQGWAWRRCWSAMACLRPCLQRACGCMSSRLEGAECRSLVVGPTPPYLPSGPHDATSQVL